MVQQYLRGHDGDQKFTILVQIWNHHAFEIPAIHPQDHLHTISDKPGDIMPTQISKIFTSLREQQLPAMIQILKQGEAFAKDKGVTEKELIEKRLFEDMHPLRWQVQTVAELALRSASRLTGAEIPSLEFNDDTFAGLIDRINENIEALSSFDDAKLDASADQDFQLPIGPDASLNLNGENYVLKFFLPNFYFHLTTTYNLLRMSGVPIGKRDFMGPVN